MENNTNKFPERTRKHIRLSNDNAFSELGKLPPQARDLEEAVLGAMMLEKDAVNDVIDILKPESFYVEAHQKIFSVIRDLFQRSDPIDILTVTAELRKRAELDFIGGAYYISKLTERIASSANAEFHARIISQKFIQRELIRVSSDIIKNSYDETSDVFEIMDKAEQSLFEISEGNFRKDFSNMKDLMSEALTQIEIAKTQKDGVSGVPSGFTELDRITSGWQPSDLVILAARPGMGKTAFVLSMARNTAVEFNKPVAIFSLEMSSVQLVQRLIASETELSADKLKKGNLANHEWEQLHSKIQNLTKAPIFIDDTPALSIFELRAKCRRLKAQHDIQMVIIDYLQLMTAGSDGKGNREQEISTISRNLKSIAKELKIPVIALSQLSRAVETRGGDKKPQLSDLRESGAIEQDADMVLFIYRPEYYGFTEDPASGASLTGTGQIIIAKHRNGALGDVNLRFIANLAKFTDIESGNYDSQARISPSKDFDNQGGSKTFSSKLNDMSDDEEMPF
ncbi:MAG: replicative DNA helicase [Bacteroidetes bacterium]|nr:replicative DNA helicase [Bacteroidota bacterium]HET6244048.1 replicative DNA helicase [Bacteroidia bacterium]